MTDTAEPQSTKPASLGERRNAARLAAVQALYQMEITKRGATAVVREFREHRLAEDGRAERVDADFFEGLVEGVVGVQAEVDDKIASVLAQGWRLERVDATVRALLRAAAYELLHRPDVPVAASIDSYVGVAAEFFEGSELGFINGALDSIARKARPDESAALSRNG